MAKTPFKFYCDECGQKISVSEKQYGIESSCPNCKVSITVPFPEGVDAVESVEAEALTSARETLILCGGLLLGALVAGAFVAL